MIESVDLIIRHPNHPERVISVGRGVTRVGRTDDNDLVLESENISRLHARIHVDLDQVRIEDAGSSAGVFLYGNRITEAELRDGDEVSLSPFFLMVRITRHGHDLSDDPSTARGPLRSARLDVLTGAGLTQASYPIRVRGLTMGRSDGCDVIVPDPAASRHHCTILPIEGRYTLKDKGSQNGTYVNEEKVEHRELNHKDCIRIGNTEFRFQMGESTLVTVTPDPAPAPRAASPDRVAPVEPAPTAVLGNHTSARGEESGVEVQNSQVAHYCLIGFAVALLSTVIGVATFMIRSGTSEVSSAHPPTWTLHIASDATKTSIDDLYLRGVNAMRSNRPSEALEQFYQVLLLDPGNPAAERLSYAAGEYLVLEGLRMDMQRKADEREIYETERDALLATALSDAPERDVAAEQLEAAYRTDPIVERAMEWTTGPERRQKLADLAKQKLDGQQWTESLEAYETLLELEGEPGRVEAAIHGVRMSRAGLAASVADDWRHGVSAEAQGQQAEATRRYQAILETDPSNPSVLRRQKRLSTEPTAP